MDIRVRPEFRIQVAATRCRIPDVTVLDRELPVEQIITHPPLAVFEILSPEDTVQRFKQKLEDYRLMGLPEIWVTDPSGCISSRYQDQQLVRSATFSIITKKIDFHMDEIRSLLD